jgi:hypothetical protein
VPRKRPLTTRDDSDAIVESPAVPSALESSAETSEEKSIERAFAIVGSPHDEELEVPAAAGDGHSGPENGDFRLSDLDDGKDDVEQRRAERHVRRVNTVVHFRESVDETWKEVIEVETVSKNGAALVLSKPCQVGRIVNLVMDMPRELRVYDQFSEVYPIAGVVQNCTELMMDESLVYHVGVAFIGKRLPESHRTDPSRTYRISGIDSSGLWTVVESPNEFATRRDPRYWQSLPVTVSYRDEQKKTTERSVLTTRDVSGGGMCLKGQLGVEIGARVKLASKTHSFFSMARVCNRSDHPTDDSRSLIHLQFEGVRFPVTLLEGSNVPTDGAQELPDQ